MLRDFVVNVGELLVLQRHCQYLHSCQLSPNNVVDPVVKYTCKEFVPWQPEVQSVDDSILLNFWLV